MSSILTIKDLSCSYGKSIVLNRLSFDVKNGEIIFIMGNNGAGKTTLLNCILQNIQYCSGEIFYNNQLLNLSSKNKLSKLIAYVPQNVNINCDFKVKDYLILGRNPYIPFGNPKKHDYNIVETYATRMGVLDIIDRPFNTLSGGQKQWVAITRALVQDAPIIVMDEPMSALDLGKQAELLSLLKILSNEGKMILLTSHNPNHCFSLPNSKVCLLHDNSILGFGIAKNVFTKNNIDLVYGTNISIRDDGSTIMFNI